MSKTIRFHLDENVDPAIAAGLSARGVDVTTTESAGLTGAGDREQLDYCRATGRVLFTMDTDFLAIAAISKDHPGIVFAHQNQTSVGRAVRGLLTIWEIIEESEIRGVLEFLT
ncbi:MAG: DUF5615 family PIN-like protein [Gemmataceae bacterium]|nr:DUF5615 family PIN-like protein [Gemmataceae bacterium]